MKRSAFYNLINFIDSNNIQDVYSKAAKKILNNINVIPQCSITEVAELCYVSTATISRLCRKLNYESFSDFKKDIIIDLNYFNDDTKRLIYDYQLPDTLSGKDAFHGHFENILDNLRATYNHLLYEDIEMIIDKIHDASHIYFMGNYFTQSVSMQLQIELAYLNKDCIGLYPLQEQKEALKQVEDNDLIILTSIAGSYCFTNVDILREISKKKCYKIVITQETDFPYNEAMDFILKVGNDHKSLIGKFSIIYIYEILEAIYHLKYGKSKSL
jgi:DNA-binding MurR/RpiR family transcriptional regulator